LGGLGPLTSTVSTYPLSALPGQSVAFDTDPLDDDLVAVGRPSIDLEITSSGSSSTLFLSLWQVRNGEPVLPPRRVGPRQLDLAPGTPTRVTVALPGGTWELPAGSTWRVLVTATDAAYAGPDEVRVDRVELAGRGLVVPTGGGVPVSTSSVWDAETLGV